MLLRGALEGIRTPDLLVRSQTLYPTELPAHFQLPEYVNTFIRKNQHLFLNFFIIVRFFCFAAHISPFFVPF